MDKLIIKTDVIDVGNLIANSNTDFTKTVQTKLINRIDKEFTEDEKQWYVGNLFMYLNYHPTNDFPINLENVVDLIGFANKANAKRSLTNNFTVNEDYKILLCRKDDHRWGGNNDETIMLNTDTFKTLCMIVKTEKAKNIRKYYVKLEKIVNMVNNEDLEEEKEKQKLIENDLRLQLEQNNKQKKLLENDNQKLIKEKELERQNILLQQFGHECNLVYIIKVKTFDDGTYVIKIGESRQGINNRFKNHKSNYEECLLLDCFLVDKCNSFEKFLHREFYKNKVTNLYGHEKEQELFLIGYSLTYEIVKNLINNTIMNFGDNSWIKYEQSKIENENLKMILHNNDNKLYDTFSDKNKLTTLENLMIKIQSSIDILTTKVNALSIKTTDNFNQPLSFISPRVQQINPVSLKLIKVYESIAECTLNHKNIIRNSLYNCVRNNTIYKGFRWFLVDRELDPYKIYNIEPTIFTKEFNSGYIAKLNTNKTEILNVYIDRQSASMLNGYGPTVLNIPIKNKKIYNGYYYCMFKDCDEQLQTNFITNYGLSVLYKDGIGQYDDDNNLINEFIHKEDCSIQLRISKDIITRSITNNQAYNGFFYRELPKKECIVDDNTNIEKQSEISVNNKQENISNINENIIIKDDLSKNSSSENEILSIHDNMSTEFIITREHESFYIAKLNNDKSEILNVYIDRKTASRLNGYAIANLSKKIENTESYNGCYFIVYNQCDVKLKNDFIKKYGEPFLYKNGIGQYDTTGNLVKEFISKISCYTELKIAHRTLNLYLDNGNTYKDFVYKVLPPKIQMVNKNLI